jgi:curved DNA-binding protein
VENGQVIRLKGYGSEGTNGGPSGDLLITFVVNNDTLFRRDGNDLYKTEDIDLYTALLGGEKTIDTLGENKT